MEQLRRQVIENGITSLDIPELLALIAQIDVKLATYILDYCGGVSGLPTLTVDQLLTLDGIGMSKALSIVAALELNKQLLNWQVWKHEKLVIQRPSEAGELITAQLSSHIQEQLIVILLDIHNVVMDIVTVYIGSLNATVVRVAEIFRPAILQNAASVIVAHNHPTGNPDPSPEDVQLTQTLVEAGLALDIPVLDHLVVGGGQWRSLREGQYGIDFDKK